MHELQTALFAHWVRKEVPPCESCGFDACEEQWTLTDEGKFRIGVDDAGDTWAAWPECPRRFAEEYAMGAGVGTVADVLSWAIERGEHRHPHLTAGAAQLCRYYLDRRDSPTRLHEHLAMPPKEQQ